MDRLDLGRYEFESGSSSKFWTIEHIGGDQYRASWGRIGSSPQGEKIYSENETYGKIDEKRSKGYRLVDSVSSKGAMVADRVKKKRTEKAEVADFLEMLRKV